MTIVTWPFLAPTQRVLVREGLIAPQMSKEEKGFDHDKLSHLDGMTMNGCMLCGGRMGRGTKALSVWVGMQPPGLSQKDGNLP